jgi:glucose-6-phosphate-specific signal transduction histidine kinase
MPNRLSKRMVIAILIYMMVQAVVFGIGVILVLATPLANIAMILMPFVVALTLVLSAPISWWLAPFARAAHERQLNAEEPGRSIDDQPAHGYHSS